MLVPLPQAFAVDRGSIRGWPDFATATSRTCDASRRDCMAPSSAAGAAGTSSSGPSSEISPTLAETSEYDDCPDDPGDLDAPATIAAARELASHCIFPLKKHPATDEGDRACVLDGSNDATCPEGKVCVDAPCLRPAP
jgi:hypothetical protein